MRAEAVPGMIAAAGEPAVVAYRAFFDDPSRSPATCKLYRRRAGAFFRWAESRGLTLALIDASALAAYAAEIASTRSQHESITYLTPVRGVLDRLALAGILPGNPCPPGQPNGRKTRDMIEEGEARLPPSDSSRPHRGIGDGPQEGAGEESPRQGAVPVGFPLLDLMAMLSHMEERSLGRIFDEDAIALRLVERVRWPEDPMCPHCGAEAGWDVESRGPAACPACGQRFNAATGTMFEGSAFPLRLWLVVIHQMYLARTAMPDAELRERFGLDLPAVLSLARRIGEAMVQEGLATGEELARARPARPRTGPGGRGARDQGMCRVGGGAGSPAAGVGRRLAGGRPAAGHDVGTGPLADRGEDRRARPLCYFLRGRLPHPVPRRIPV